MKIASLTEWTQKLSTLRQGRTLPQGRTLCCFIKTMIKMRRMHFVDIVYDECYGIRKPIGVIHSYKLPSGETKEIFTFCGSATRRAQMALFVKSRTGNRGDQITLTFDRQEAIPEMLKTLPTEYKARIMAHC